MAYSYVSSQSAKKDMEKALQHALGTDYHSNIDQQFTDRFVHTPDYAKLRNPGKIISGSVEVTRNIAYGNHGQKLDLYRPRHCDENLPVLLQIHGGGSVLGSKSHQALPLMNHMVLRGWICVSLNYHLSPTATFPEHIVDCKEGLVWVKKKIREYGGNPDIIVVTGGSAGGASQLTAGTHAQ